MSRLTPPRWKVYDLVLRRKNDKGDDGENRFSIVESGPNNVIEGLISVRRVRMEDIILEISLDLPRTLFHLV